MKTSFILPYFDRLPYLHATLTTFAHFYADRQDVEIIVVDDGSDIDQKADKLKWMFTKRLPGLQILDLNEKVKSGGNPCLPYNVGARKSTGDVLILSSPETLHTKSIFDLTDFANLGVRDYFCFSVFCPTDVEFNELVLNTIAGFRIENLRKEVERQVMEPGFGEHGRDKFNNGLGSFYLHSKYRPTALNFFTAIRREFYDELSGFDERFRKGTGFDDTEYRDRLIQKVGKVHYFDDALALHLNHPPVYGKGDPISNIGLYERIKQGKEPVYQSNNSWGLN